MIFLATGKCNILLGALLVLGAVSWANDANRFVYLDESDPYYVSGEFPKLSTPQWIGEPGVEAAIFLSIDDMRETGKYEEYLRPILTRLKAIEGQAPLSILTCSVQPDDPQLQAWLQEGVEFDVHTITHPCPLLGPEDLAWSKANVDDCLDLLASVPGSHPVAFRMPCCDSQNTPSPRFYAEIFNRTSPKGAFLQIDSSIFNVSTSTDRFRNYLPFPSFVNTIEDYPYPYVIGKLAWEFPCTVPSDWEAQNIHGVSDPRTVEDMKAALDLAYRDRGIYTLVFHPHGWIRNDLVVDVIDYAAMRYGKSIRFLTFRDALDRIQRNLLKGEALRAADGTDNGVRLIDLNGDGSLDVLIGNDRQRITRIWSSTDNTWSDSTFPTKLTDNPGVRFGTGSAWDNVPVMFECTDSRRNAWRFAQGSWHPDATLLEGLELDGVPLLMSSDGHDTGVRLRDIDGDGQCEVIAGGPVRRAVFEWRDERWHQASYMLPEGVILVDSKGRDAGLRFVDLDDDGDEDLVFSNDTRFGVYRFETGGWHVVHEAFRSRVAEGTFTIPPIVSNGMNAGAWFHSGHLWWQNENTDELPDLVDRRSYVELLDVDAN